MKNKFIRKWILLFSWWEKNYWEYEFYCLGEFEMFFMENKIPWWGREGFIGNVFLKFKENIFQLTKHATKVLALELYFHVPKFYKNI